MFRIVTHCLGAFRRPFCSSIGTQLGAKHHLPPPPGTEACIKTFERITICVWRRGGGGGGERFWRKYKEI